MTPLLLLLLLAQLTYHPHSPWLAASTTVAVGAVGASAVYAYAYVRHVDDDDGTSPAAQLAWAVWVAEHPCDACAAFWAWAQDVARASQCIPALRVCLVPPVGHHGRLLAATAVSAVRPHSRMWRNVNANVDWPCPLASSLSSDASAVWRRAIRYKQRHEKLIDC